MKKELTQKELSELLYYDKETGNFIWLVGKGPAKIGSVAGVRVVGESVKITIDGKLYLAHRLAFLYMTGKFPDDIVRHMNDIGDDNRWSNLHEKLIVPKPGVTECDVTGMYRDENGNYWSTLKDANEYVNTMINCSGCIDCHKCTDCHGCSDSSWSSHCRNCDGCHDCRNCVDCKGCYYTTGCIDGIDLIAV